MSASWHDLAQATDTAAAEVPLASALACQGCFLPVCKGQDPVQCSQDPDCVTTPALCPARYQSITHRLPEPPCTLMAAHSVLPENQGCHHVHRLALPDMAHLLDLTLIGSAIAIGCDGNLPILLHLVVQPQPHSQGHLHGCPSVGSCLFCRLTSDWFPAGSGLGRQADQAALDSAGEPLMCACRHQGICHIHQLLGPLSSSTSRVK